MKTTFQTDEFYENPHRFKQIYNLRERLNIYAGVTSGLLAPVIFHRYFHFPLESKNIGEESIKWVCAGMISLGHLELDLLSFVAGTYIGFSGANNLRNKRINKERIAEKERRGELHSPRFGDEYLTEGLRR